MPRGPLNAHSSKALATEETLLAVLDVLLRFEARLGYFDRRLKHIEDAVVLGAQAAAFEGDGKFSAAADAFAQHCAEAVE